MLTIVYNSLRSLLQQLKRNKSLNKKLKEQHSSLTVLVKKNRVHTDYVMMLTIAMIVSAQGEATSAELIGRAVQRNAGYVTLRRIETAKEISKILAQGNNRLVLDADSLLLNVKENEKFAPLLMMLMFREMAGRKR